MKLRVGARQIEISNPDKIVFPDASLSKADCVSYYRKIGPWMLPHVSGRPLTLKRYPDGIDSDGFYQQSAPRTLPDYVGREELPKKDGGVLEHICVTNIATLVYLANLGTVAIHRWLSRIDLPDFPDRLVFDLDPPGTDFEPVRTGARLLHELLEKLGLFALPMTTGSSGLHVVVPLDRRCDFAASRRFARRLAVLLAARHSDILTTEQRKDKRGDRLYLDVLRNGYGQSAVAPFSLRAKPGAPVAAPLEWAELFQGGIDAASYRLDNIFRRLGQKEDPWKGMGRRARSLAAAGKRLERLAAAGA